MAKKQNSSTTSEGVCKKIYRAVSINPIRSTKPPHIIDHHPILITETIPVNFEHSSSSSPTNVSAHNKAKNVTFFSSPNFATKEVAILGGDHNKHDQVKKTERTKANDDKFSDYITRVKDKMKSSASNVGGRKSATRRDSFNDKVSSYINRAKFKIRTTTTMTKTNVEDG
ncbi:hypothetical protein ABFS82_04G024200 [Erythranthe guttata]|uniref:Uncharacterized protein n=1 Tax=Erythranthe guttata TaxID=4155 RepID=A0A022S1H5_ERYGU|nr:hypothetical protein MIMGU_mgv1a015057mg [Erythranthe guttata]